MINAAGVIFIANGHVLLLKRSENGDMGGTWANPGGKIEEGETIAEAVKRECIEEIGVYPPGSMQPFTRSNDGFVDYTTFTQAVKEFTPELNDEHTDYVWAPLGEYPEPMHPGCLTSLKKLTMTELDVAKGIRDGIFPSPSQFHNVTLCAFRISGTGVAYRGQHNEFVYRDPADYLSDEFLARCHGLPIIAEHPVAASLDSKEFQDRIVGTILLPYVKGDEAWGIGKLYDDTIVELLKEHQLSTSPTVMFIAQALNTKLALEDGSTLLIEGKPSVLDHLAICVQGVWDKGKPPSGVEITNGVIKMTDEERLALEDKKKDQAKKDAAKKADATNEEAGSKEKEEKVTPEKVAADKAKADAKAKADKAKADGKKADDDDEEGDNEGDKLDKVLSLLGDISARTDSLEKAEKARSDAAAKAVADAAAKAKADAEEKETEEEKAARMKKEADSAAKAKADEEAEAKKKADDDTRKRIADLESKMPKEMSDAEVAEMADTQSKADAVFQAHGKAAPRPLSGETRLNYRKRLIGHFREHSPTWKDIDLSTLPDSVINVAEPQIYADAMAAAMNPVTIGTGQLRERVKTDATGRRITEFHGEPDAWLGQFKLMPRRLTKIVKERA